MVICLEQDADLHVAQLMPVPLTVSCFSKIQIGFAFLVLVYPSSPGKGLLNGCVCARACACVCLCFLQSTVLVGRSIQELCELMTDLPDYASHFVNMICRILQEYLDSCQHAYHGVSFILASSDKCRFGMVQTV